MCPIEERAHQEKVHRAEALKQLAADRAARAAARAAAPARPPQKRKVARDDNEESDYETDSTRHSKKRKDDISSMGTKRKSSDTYDDDDDFIASDSESSRPSKRMKGAATAAKEDPPARKDKNEKPKPRNKHEKMLHKYKNKIKITNTLGGSLFSQCREDDVFLAKRRKEVERKAVQRGATAEVKEHAQAIEESRVQALSKFGALFGGKAGGAKKKVKSEEERKALFEKEGRKIAAMKAKKTKAMEDEEAKKAQERRIYELEELQKQFNLDPVARSAEAAMPPADQEDEFAYLFEESETEKPKPAPVAQMIEKAMAMPAKQAAAEAALADESTDESFEGASTSTPNMSDDETSATSAHSPVAAAAQMLQLEQPPSKSSTAPPGSPAMALTKENLEANTPQTASRPRRRVAPTRISDTTRKVVEGAS